MDEDEDQPYRLHRVGPGDEQVLGILAQGNARFGEDSDVGWLPPLGADEAARFVGDERTILLVALDRATSQIAGFVYGCVLYRRHTKLEHLCIYEIGLDVDHRRKGVGQVLLGGIAREARDRGIERGFVVTTANNREAVQLYEAAGGQRSTDIDVVFGFRY